MFSLDGEIGYNPNTNLVVSRGIALYRVQSKQAHPKSLFFFIFFLQGWLMFLFLFQVINLSEKKHDLTKMNPKVIEIDLFGNGSQKALEYVGGVCWLCVR